MRLGQRWGWSVEPQCRLRPVRSAAIPAALAQRARSQLGFQQRRHRALRRSGGLTAACRHQPVVGEWALSHLREEVLKWPFIARDGLGTNHHALANICCRWTPRPPGSGARESARPGLQKAVRAPRRQLHRRHHRLLRVGAPRHWLRAAQRAGPANAVVSISQMRENQKCALFHRGPLRQCWYVHLRAAPPGGDLQLLGAAHRHRLRPRQRRQHHSAGDL
mmetsp:Transcript_52342/g.93921  ORF Transcript_52342/g.93921 Transcript_52342/m.93921 type:complete len:220 (-) Transcript_52342:260-919(-)